MKTNSYLTRSESTRPAGAAENASLRQPARTQVRGGIAVLLVLGIAAAGNLTARAQTAAPPPPVVPAQIATNTPEVVVQPPPPAAPAQVTTNALEALVQPPPAAPDMAVESSTNAPAAAVANPGSTNGLRLNFRNAPIEQVLTYLADAAGFIIELDTPVRGSITVLSSQAMTRDEAVDVLNSVLNRNGYAAIRAGPRTLRIMGTEEAKTSQIPVIIGNNPTNIPNNDEIVTQIIPVNFVEAAQLIKDLSLMTPPHATIIANEAGNEVIITDTQANIRHLVEIIKAIDSSAETGTELHVFKLIYHDPQEVADILNNLFSSQNNTGSQSPLSFVGNRGGGRGGGGRGGGFGGGGRGGGAFGGPGGFLAALTGGNSGGNNQADRIKKRDQVIVTADERTGQVIVMASKDLISQIGAMIADIDVPSDKVTKVTTIAVNYGDAQQMQQVLQNMFPNNNARANNANQNSALQTRIQQQINSSQSTGSGMNFGAGTRTGALP